MAHETDEPVDRRTEEGEDEFHGHIGLHGAGEGEYTSVELDLEGLEMFSLRSVGIDIGSSTSHLVFSHLTLRREGAALSARFTVTEREVLYRSPILLTPYLSHTQIDVEKLTAFFHQAYADAGFTPDDIDTGAVVITGEALKKENARPIVEFFARDSGKFICASAGPNHEALLAAYGSGAAGLSSQEKAAVLNVDIGGGTSKFSIVKDGVVTETAAVNIGARLIAYDESDVATRVEDAARTLMQHLGGDVRVGDRVDPQRREQFSNLMADVLIEVIKGGPLSPLTQSLMITDPLSGAPNLEGVKYIVFSGGVSEYIYEHERTSYGDMGALIARAIRERLKQLPSGVELREPSEGIRATVIGAGEYTVQVSGNTSFISSARALPAFGLQVVRPALEAGDPVDEAFRKALAKFDLERYSSNLAFAISLDRVPDYKSIRRVAEGISAIVRQADGEAETVFLVMDMDVAKSLGGILKEELKLDRDIVAVDGIDVGDLDYIDIGRPMGVSESLPVTVKSLLFPTKADALV